MHVRLKALFLQPLPERCTGQKLVFLNAHLGGVLDHLDLAGRVCMQCVEVETLVVWPKRSV